MRLPISNDPFAAGLQQPPPGDGVGVIFETNRGNDDGGARCWKRRRIEEQLRWEPTTTMDSDDGDRVDSNNCCATTTASSDKNDSEGTMYDSAASIDLSSSFGTTDDRSGLGGSAAALAGTTAGIMKSHGRPSWASETATPSISTMFGSQQPTATPPRTQQPPIQYCYHCSCYYCTCHAVSLGQDRMFTIA